MPDECDHSCVSTNWDWVSRRRGPLLVLAGSLAAILVMWGIARADKHRRQHEAFAKLQALGGVFGWDGANTFYGVNLTKRPIGDEDIALVEVFDDFDHVSIGYTRVSDAGLRHLRGLRGLELLYMQDTQVGDEGLRQLSGLRQLKALNLSGTRVTDEGLRYLEGMQELESLSLSRTRVSDYGVFHLKRLRALRNLNIYAAEVSEKGIAELRAAIPGLTINWTVNEQDQECCP